MIDQLLRRLTALLVLSTLIAAIVGLGGCASSGNTRNIESACGLFGDNPEWKQALFDTQEKWGTPVHVQMAILHQESKFQFDARPGRKTFLGIPLWRKSSAYGFAQVKDDTWDWYKEKTGRRFASRDNFADAVDFIGWYTNVSQRTLGISKWDAYNQYLAYHEGHGGFKRKTYNKKAWLVKVAQKVKAKAASYSKQIKSCPGSGSGFSIWPF